MKLAELQSKIKELIADLEMPDTNNPEGQRLAYLYATSKILGVLSKLYNQDDRIKQVYSDNLKAQGTTVELFSDACISLTAKVMEPRATFDRNAFISKISEAYNINAVDLFHIADESEKLSAPPVSINYMVK